MTNCVVKKSVNGFRAVAYLRLVTASFKESVEILLMIVLAKMKDVLTTFCYTK